MSDYTFNEKRSVSIGDAERFTAALYEAAGMGREDAETVAKNLVEADARGVYSHGIQRNSLYIKRFEKGGTSPTGRPFVEREFAATAVVNGDNAMGMVVCEYAMNKAIELGKKYGTGAVAITGSNHFGTCAHYIQQAVDAGMIGFVYTINCGNIMAPWGGVDRVLGNNPFGMGVPCRKHADVIMDMATSIVARGKIVVARKTHTPIPADWAIDTEGRPTTDADKAYWGCVQPFAGYKGYNLTFMNAVVSAILTNSSFGDKLPDLYEDPDKVQNSAHLFFVIDINAIDDVEAFKDRMDETIDFIKNGKKAVGFDEIFVPGEIEANCQKKAREEGIVYPVEILDENNALAEKYGLPAELRL